MVWCKMELHLSVQHQNLSHLLQQRRRSSRLKPIPSRGRSPGRLEEAVPRWYPKLNKFLLGEREPAELLAQGEPLQCVTMLGRFLFGRAMKNDWAKIPLVAKDLGVSVKTIYNWVSAGKIYMPQPGFVSREEAYSVFVRQKELRTFYSYFQSAGIVRDSFGKFSRSKDND